MAYSGYIDCPLCSKKINGLHCYQITKCAYGGLPKNGVVGIISGKRARDGLEICKSCKYHLLEGKRRLKYDNPDWDLDEAHAYCSGNRASLLEDKRCGCFFCFHIFSPKEILEYIPEHSDDEQETTALCPYCGVDSVIGEKAGYPITENFLQAMYDRWFEPYPI